jgi:hypothetical protein
MSSLCSALMASWSLANCCFWVALGGTAFRGVALRLAAWEKHGKTESNIANKKVVCRKGTP